MSLGTNQLAAGLGYLKINNSAKYDDLPKPLIGYGDDFVVTTSMTHQLHCLVSEVILAN